MLPKRKEHRAGPNIGWGPALGARPSLGPVLRPADHPGGVRYALGITTVHVNRVVQQMRADDLVRTKGTVLTVLDWEALKRVGDFDPIYVHLT
ncbi:Crp-like helix-turn-helix protein [Microvirga subterranea]|uniref:Crp-like helix-turn-helix protein n=1 Tax=Microvirga subterranea TaxID=186651 RepID=A0A370H8N1_9HYPH|nr:Crp-like helix-turn-helix protein [Microvirga subterranea]